MIQLTESKSSDPGWRIASDWRFLAQRGKLWLPQDCEIEINEDEMSGRIGAHSVAELNAAKCKAFPRFFHFSEVQFSDGLFWMGFRSMVFDWKEPMLYSFLY